MFTAKFDSLLVHRLPTRAELGAAAAEHVTAVIRAAYAERGEARVVFACAPSQNEFFDALAWEQIDWSRVVIFHMDEYIGLKPEHPQAFRQYLRRNLLSRIGKPLGAHLIAAESAPVREAKRYAALLAEKPLDLVCMGIGENGHIAFNDPPNADFKDPAQVKVVELDATCRQQQVNDGCFRTLTAVPKRALTLTIPALVSARRISCVVPGERKAAAVKSMCLGAIRKTCPASILRRHPGAVLFIDNAAAALLPR